MAIISETEAETDLVDEAAGVEFAARIDAVLLDIEPHRLAVAGGQIEAGRHAIKAFIPAVGDAEAAGVGDEGGADAGGPGPRRAVGQAAAQIGQGVDRRIATGLCGGSRGPRQDEVADAQIRRSVVAAIGLDDDAIADRQRDDTGDIALFRRRAIAAEQIEMQAFLQHLARDALVDDIDDAANRRRSIEQRGRAAQHLDPFGKLGVDHHGMIDRGVGDVEAADAVRQHADALALEAAQDRPRGVGTEAR